MSPPVVTEITLAGSERLRVEGAAHDVEAAIVSAARGSILELAWLTDADSGQRVGISPEQVLMLRALEPASNGGSDGGDRGGSGEGSASGSDGGSGGGSGGG